MHLNSEAGGANDPIAAVAALKSLQPDLARRALYAIRLGRLEVNIYHCNTAISVTGKNGNLWPDVLGLLERIRTWLVKPTASTFNAAIAAQGCQDSSWSRSIDIWRSMKAVQVEPDVITQNSLAARCNSDREGQRWQLALDLAGRDVVGIGTRLAACEVGGCWLLSLELLRTLASDVVLNRVLCNAVISVCASCGKWQHALLLLASMFGWSVRADTADFNAAMSAAAKSDGSQWALAFSIQEKLVQSRLVPSEVTVNTAIAASEQGDKWELALQLKQGMTRWQLVPSPVTWVASVSSTAREWPVSLSVLEIMCQEEPFPGNLPFRAAVIASWCHALGLAQSSITSCNAAMTACRNQGKWQAVLLLFQQTRGFCLQPTVISGELPYLCSSRCHRSASLLTQVISIVPSVLVKKQVNGSLQCCCFNVCEIFESRKTRSVTTLSSALSPRAANGSLRWLCCLPCQLQPQSSPTMLPSPHAKKPDLGKWLSRCCLLLLQLTLFLGVLPSVPVRRQVSGHKL